MEKLYERPPANEYSLEDDGSLVFMETKTTSVAVNNAGVRPYSQIRVWGVTATRHSVVLLINDFNPYFMVHLPNHIAPDTMKKRLNSYLGREYPKEVPSNAFIVSMEHVQRKSIMGYKPPGTGMMDLLKVVLCAPRYLSKARDALDDGVATSGYQCKTYEANVPYTMRFMIDIDLCGFQWLRCPPGTFTVETGNLQRVD